MEKKTMEGTKGTRSPLFPSTRSSVYMMMFITTALHSAARYTMNLSIVCMVKPPQRLHMNQSAEDDNITTEDFMNTTIGLPSSCEQSLKTETDFGYEGEFDWSRSQVGYILAAFFYTYIPMQVLVGYLADRFGIRHVLGTGILIGGILNLLTPVAARLHYGLLLALRAAMGCAMGVMYPCIHSCIGRWVPLSEKSTFIGWVFSGSSIGNIVSSLISGFLCKYSWTFVFYIFGGVTIIWYAVFRYVVYSSPEEHPRISEQEKNFLKESTAAKDSSAKPVKIPWLRMLTSGSVWGMCASHFSMLFVFRTILVGLPLYFQDVMYFNIKENGMLSAVPHLTSLFGLFIMGAVCDVVHRRIIKSKRFLRKFSESCYALSVMTLAILVSYMNCHQRAAAVVMLCLIKFSMCFRSAGGICSPSDIAPEMAGVVYGFTNFVGNFAGFLAPIAIGNLTQNGSQAEWQRVFLLAAGTLAVGWLSFMLLVGVEEEPWARVDTTPEQQQELEVQVRLTNGTEKETTAK